MRAEEAAEFVSAELGKLKSLDLSSELQYAEAARLEARTFRLALVRDKAMAAGIEKYARAYPDRIPIAFVGDYHTQGILSKLPTRFAVAIFEPRGSSSVREDDYAQYQQALRMDQYQNALGGRKVKIQVAPRANQLPFYRAQASQALSEARIREQKVAGLAAGGPNTAKSLATVLRQSPELGNVGVEIAADGAGDLPAGLEAAFASFDISAQGRTSKILVLDRTDERWTASDRVSVLAAARMEPWPFRSMVGTPLESRSLRPSIRRVKIFDAGNKMYAIVDDFKSDRRYFLEQGADMNIKDLLQFQPGTIHIEVVRRFLQFLTQERLNG